MMLIWKVVINGNETGRASGYRRGYGAGCIEKKRRGGSQRITWLASTEIHDINADFFSFPFLFILFMFPFFQFDIASTETIILAQLRSGSSD